MRTSSVTAVIFAGIFLLIASVGVGAIDLSPLGKKTGPRDSIIVADSRGKILYEKNGDLKKIPASTLKVFTALTAMHYLKPDYRFPTRFYTDSNGDLFIRGFGDPLFISEVMPEICGILAEKTNRVRDIVLDDGFFAQVKVPGVSPTFQPYDSPVGAICANFNSVFFKRSGKTFVSAEPQTPLLPFVMDRIRASGYEKERIVLSDRNKENVLYAGHLFRHFLTRAGVVCTGSIRLGKVDESLHKCIFEWRSPFSLETVLKRLLTYSNNFIANQLLLASGAAAFGPPATLEKGVDAARNYGKNVLGIEMTIEEGSGISRKNRLTAGDLNRILETFRPFRKLLKKEGRQYYKTGNLSGIQTRVGYIENRDGEIFSFVVMTDTPGKSVSPVMAELLRLIP